MSQIQIQIRLDESKSFLVAIEIRVYCAVYNIIYLHYAYLLYTISLIDLSAERFIKYIVCESAYHYTGRWLYVYCIYLLAITLLPMHIIMHTEQQKITKDANNC